MVGCLARDVMTERERKLMVILVGNRVCVCCAFQ